MSTPVPQAKPMPRKIGSGDRLGVTILFSVIAHGVLALGLTFEYEKPKPSLPSLEDRKSVV